jgi:transcriptional regulator GlxA family with amidase domain
MQQLRSVVAELFAALACALNDERDSAEDSLSRAAEILQEVDVDQPPPRQETKGGLAPWQIRKVASHIETNLDMPIRSSDLASIAGLSPGHFSRVFRNSFGCSPLEYVTSRRVEHAQGLMLATDAPLSQIALDCGLADQAHFSRLFRRCVGETPRAWRRARIASLAASDLTAA